MSSTMSRKRKRDKPLIDGLTTSILKNMSATNSYHRGLELFYGGSVRIDSLQSLDDGSIEASIVGKDYEINISFENPVRSTLDISANCSCPDNRDGACKHVIAVLCAVVDDQPQAKKKKSNTSNKRVKKYTISELKQGLESMEKQQLIDIIEDALKSKDVQSIVSAKLNAIGEEEIDLSGYKSEIYEALHQLDGMRPSKQFEQSYKVGQDLNEVMDAARKYFKVGNSTGAMQILLALAESVSDADGIEGEVWKSLHDCGGIDRDIAELMLSVVESDEEMQSNQIIRKAIVKIHCDISGYGCDDYQDVLDCFKTEE